MAGRTSTGGLAGVPAPLAAAITAATKKYPEAPADILAGIWRRETGSKYPNPWENGLGYGGEFGTRMSPAWGPTASVRQIVEPPLQDQADTAAQILAQNIRSHGGDVSAALLAYSGGGYSSVAGETTFGVVSPAGVDPTGAQVAGAPARPGVGGGGGGGGIWGDIVGGVEGAGGWVGHEAGSVFGSVEGAIESAITGPVAFLKAAAWLLNPLTWLRAVEALFGFALILGAVIVLSGIAGKALAGGGPPGMTIPEG